MTEDKKTFCQGCGLFTKKEVIKKKYDPQLGHKITTIECVECHYQRKRWK